MNLTYKLLGQIFLIIVWIGSFFLINMITKDEKVVIACCTMGFLLNTHHIWFE